MDKKGALKIAIIAGLIVAAITVFIFTPLSEKIFEKTISVKTIEKDKNTTNKTIKHSISNDRETYIPGNIVSKKEGETQIQNEDFSSYINPSIANTSGKTDIAVTIVDEDGNILNSISNSIADIYNVLGNKGNLGLLRSSFVHKSYFQELFEGNTKIIEKLKLNSHTDYIAIGKIKYLISKETLVDGTFICTASLTMNIISANLKSLIKSFTCSANGNGATEEQAKEYAINKLLSKYISEYSSI